MLFPRRLQGVLVQGSQEGIGIVSNFTLEFGMEEEHLMAYEEYPGERKVIFNNTVWMNY